MGKPTFEIIISEPRDAISINGFELAADSGETLNAYENVQAYKDSDTDVLTFKGQVEFDSVRTQRVFHANGGLELMSDAGGLLVDNENKWITPINFNGNQDTNAWDIGSSANRFKDGYFRGKLFADSVMADVGIEFAGTLSDGTIKITQFDNDGNLAANSATRVPTQAAVKAYVDANSGPTVTQTINTSTTQVPSANAVKLYVAAAIAAHLADSNGSGVAFHNS